MHFPWPRSLLFLTLLALAPPAFAQAIPEAPGQAQLRQQQFNEQMYQGYLRSQQNQGGGGYAAPAPPPPPPRQPFVSSYEQTFGAMAKAQDDRQFAFSVGRYFASDAAAEAKDKCERQSGQPCSLVRTFQNACATLSWPTALGTQPEKLSTATMAVETTSTHSRELAVNACAKIHGTQCRVGYMACALPMLKTEMRNDLWSAIAIDPATATVFPAIGSGYNTASARAAAFDLCQRDRRTTGECQVLDHFKAGECRYLARSPMGIREKDYVAIIRERSNPALAKQQCEQAAGTACEIVYQGCS